MSCDCKGLEVIGDYDFCRECQMPVSRQAPLGMHEDCRTKWEARIKINAKNNVKKISKEQLTKLFEGVDK